MSTPTVAAPAPSVAVNDSSPQVIETSGHTISERRPGLAKTRPSNVIPFAQILRRVAR